jgi:hypothetical protein
MAFGDMHVSMLAAVVVLGGHGIDAYFEIEMHSIAVVLKAWVWI